MPAPLGVPTVTPPPLPATSSGERNAVQDEMEETAHEIDEWEEETVDSAGPEVPKKQDQTTSAGSRPVPPQQSPGKLVAEAAATSQASPPPAANPAAKTVPSRTAAASPAHTNKLLQDAPDVLSSQSDALNQLAGAIPNIEKEALQLYNTFGGDDADAAPQQASPSFLQVARSKSHQTNTALSRKKLNEVWKALSAVAEETREGLSMIQHLEAEGISSEADDDGQNEDTSITDKAVAEDADVKPSSEECTWLLQSFEKRSSMRAQEADWLQEARAVFGSAARHHSQAPPQLRGQPVSPSSEDSSEDNSEDAP